MGCEESRSKENYTLKHLFIDDRFVEKRSDLRRRFHQAVPCEQNPVLRAEKPWENEAAFIDSAIVVYDEAKGVFRAWDR